MTLSKRLGASLVYKSDKEKASSPWRTRRSGDPVAQYADCLLAYPAQTTTAVPESSAVGEFASGGKAARCIQAVEDLLCAQTLALEARIKARNGSKHAILGRLAEHVAHQLTKLSINATVHSPYGEFHGHKAQKRRVQFGEHVFFFTPKKVRAKLDRRWKLEVYLGHAANSNEVYV